jgi:hypothetical protein
MGVSKMSGTRIARHAATIGLGAALAAIAACAEVEVAPTESLAGSQAAEQVAALTELRERYDDDGDGFVSRVEAEGYWRRHFGRLDDNDDGRLSRTELEPEAPARRISSRPTRSWSGRPSRTTSGATSASSTAASIPRSA